MRSSRRAFLSGVAAAPALGMLSRLAAAPAVTPPTAPATHSSFDPWVEVRPAALAHNVAEVARRVGGRPILAVIKNNGYGLGVVNVARALDGLDAVAGLAVVTLHEAVTLREAGIGKPVLLMGPFDERDLETAVARRIMPMVYTEVGDTLDRLAGRFGRPVPLHVCIDTGIGRVGVPYREAVAFVRQLALRRGARIEGTMMTFTEDPSFDKEQLVRFTVLCTLLEEEGHRLGRRHAVSSFGLFQHPDAFLDMVRPGMAIFGVYPAAEFRSAGVMDLRPAVSLRARVAYVKQLRRGDGAGYERAYVAKSNVWVATMPVGHVDGLPRTAVKGARVRIGDALYPLIGTVSASHSLAEIGPERRVSIGDEVTYFDDRAGSRPEDFGQACGASVYDLLMHLNPLLPRRVVEA
jgi:alanine racemase